MTPPPPRYEGTMNEGGFDEQKRSRIGCVVHDESGAEIGGCYAPICADPVTVLPAQREALEQLVRSRSTTQQLALCARMILHAADGVGVRESARELDVWPKTVRYWRRRWRQAADGQSVPERLTDAPWSRAPATYTPEQICAVIAMTCEKPSDSERPISHSSQRDIADEAIRPGLVPSISQRSVGRFLEKSPISTRIASLTG
jgi:putative transposase